MLLCADNYTMLPALAAGALFGARRLLRFLRYLQQEQYYTLRFISWHHSHRTFDSRATLAALVVFAASLLSPCSGVTLSLAASVYLLWLALYEENPLRGGKLSLVFTLRAKRIYLCALALSLIFILFVYWLSLFEFFGPSQTARFWLLGIIFFQSPPYLLALANLILLPLEKCIQARFLKEAREKYRHLSPFTIGITGSYGKTSTKAILGELLTTAVGPVFWPKKGVNSLMGITRSIREDLLPAHKWAVVEMAAFQRGSIRKLCDLTPPNAGIITAVGLMHLERFKTKENIFLAKSELAEAVPADGILVCNADDEGARGVAEKFPKATTVLYSINGPRAGISCAASDISFTETGTRFVLHCEGSTFEAFIPLLGKPAVSNALGAFAMCKALGCDTKLMLAALRTIRPVDNRLNLVKESGVLYLRDAYNSNPIGFAAALEVLEQLPGRRKILVTPGVVELGARQFEENLRLAELARKVCSIVFIVARTNREAWLKGIGTEKGDALEVKTFDHRDPALAELRSLVQSEDAVLIENDLPDLYEEIHPF